MSPIKTTCCPRHRSDYPGHRRNHARGSGGAGERTVLDHDVEALLDEEVIVEHNEAKGKREDIVAAADLEEVANISLRRGCRLAR